MYLFLTELFSSVELWSWVFLNILSNLSRITARLRWKWTWILRIMSNLAEYKLETRFEPFPTLINVNWFRFRESQVQWSNFHGHMTYTLNRSNMKYLSYVILSTLIIINIRIVEIFQTILLKYHFKKYW